MKSRLSPAILLALAYGMRYREYNTPDADDGVINPPPSEKMQKTLIEKAKVKRLRKNDKRLLEKEIRETYF